MNPNVLFWGCLLLAFLAGVGTIPTIGLFRYQEPVTLPRKPRPPAAPAPSNEGPKQEPPRHAAPVTARHGYDTMDVLVAGWQAAQEQHGDRYPGRVVDGTWLPDPDRHPYPPAPEQLPAGGGA